MDKEVDIQPPMPPQWVDPPTVVTPLPIGYPSKPKGGRIYISTQGDWWDMIAIRVYGRKRGNESLMYRLIEANYNIRELSFFPAGIPVNVPEVDVATTIPLVPWKTATIRTP